MSATLIPCPACGRHARAGEARCPSCAAAWVAAGRSRALRAEREPEAVGAREGGVSPTTSESSGR